MRAAGGRVGGEETAQSKKISKKNKTLQHTGFPGDPSTQYWWCSILFNFGDQTGSGVFRMI